MVPPTATRTRAKRGEGEKLRQEIIVAAERLLGEAGSKEAVSIRAIADACNVTPPAIYLHFADKDQLFLEVCSMRFREMDAWIGESAAKTDDPLESLRLMGKAYISFGVEHPEAYRLLMMTLHEGRIDEPGMEAGRDAFMHLVQAVERCVDAGALGDAKPYETSLILWSGIHGLTSLFVSFPNFDWGEQAALVDHLMDVMIEGLLSV